jgi:hypothetical protein
MILLHLFLLLRFFNATRKLLLRGKLTCYVRHFLLISIRQSFYHATLFLDFGLKFSFLIKQFYQQLISLLLHLHALLLQHQLLLCFLLCNHLLSLNMHIILSSLLLIKLFDHVRLHFGHPLLQFLSVFLSISKYLH